jgi:MoaA/NifB/PqqE/SkfB family radical SAM enzyme
MDEPMQAYTEPLSRDESIRFIEDRLGGSLGELSGFPRYIYIETVNYCNARCIMCGIDFDDRARATKIMAAPLFEKLIREIAEHQEKIEKVMLYLDCEPLVDRRLHEKIRYLKESGISKVNIATNGSLLHEERAIELVDFGLDEIYITVDSLKREVYEGIRIGLDFDRVMENTLKFVEVRDEKNPQLTIRIQAILLEENYREAEAIKAYWLNVLQPTDQVVLQKAHNWGNTISVMKVGDEEFMNNIPCKSLWGTCVIHSDGQVGLCSMDASRSIILGDVNQQSIAEVWNGGILEAVREEHLNASRERVPICNGCTHWREGKREIEQPAT